MALVVGAVHLAWASGSTIGLPGELVSARTRSSYVVNAIDGATMVAAAIGVLMLVHRVGRSTRFWIPLTLAWIGGGFLFAWGLWGLINVLGDTALVRGRVGAAPWLNLLALIQLIAGLLIGVVMLILLAERAEGGAARAEEHARQP